MQKIDTKKLVHVALLIAIQIVLSRFLSISTPISKIGFGFLPIAICGMLYGPVWGGVCGGLSDFIGAILFPIGAYFPGYTLCAVLTGLVFGFFLSNQNKRISSLCFAVLIDCLIISLFINTYWISFTTGNPYLVMVASRLPQVLVMIPVEFVLLRLVQKSPVTTALKRRHA